MAQKIFRFLFLFCVLIFSIDVAQAENEGDFNFSLVHNTSEKKLIARIYQIDHSLRIIGEFNFITAEMRPGKINRIDEKYFYGLYRAEFKYNNIVIVNTNGFKVEKGIEEVVVYSDGTVEMKKRKLK